MTNEDNSGSTEENHSSPRAGLVWEVLVFQARLIADGFRDLALVPISLLSALWGLIAGGNEPDRYFKQVLILGRRTENWINLFGHRTHEGTSDEIIEPLRERVMSEAQNREWVQRAGKGINKTLDNVNERIESAAKPKTNHQDEKKQKE